MAERRRGYISTVAELRDYLGADTYLGMNRCMYKSTDCGASISLYLRNGTELHNGLNREGWERVKSRDVVGFSIQTIIEGSDATVDSDVFKFPVREVAIADWIIEMEAEAARLWDEANEQEEGGK